jgi:hypothetical protein
MDQIFSYQREESLMHQSLKNICLALMIILYLTGCQTIGGVAVESPGYHGSKYEKKGPPPHAPAHGYRHKHHDGHQLVYDSKIGAYVVVNLPDTYFANDLYLRMSTDGRWMASATLGRGWRVALASEIPPKMRHSKHKGKHKKYYDD